MRFDFRSLVNCILNFNFQRVSAVAVSAVTPCVCHVYASSWSPHCPCHYRYCSLPLFSSNKSASFLAFVFTYLFIHNSVLSSSAFCRPHSTSALCAACGATAAFSDDEKKYWLLNVLRICDLICDSDATSKCWQARAT